ncbi:MAG TPA: polysaccharide deacetylase family protein [Acidimicrobiales bacterium]|nr:polysaccharide deacetylase family protein [Acidimicrobiales bacterium]
MRDWGTDGAGDPARRYRGVSGAVGRLSRRAAGIGAAALAAQYVPSIAVLGQWSGLRSVGGGICRWRGPKVSQIALTFDDGPSPEATPAVLDRLDELGWPATFFCLGSLVEREPDLVAEILRRGHQVETHGYRHDHHLLRTPRWILRDLRAALGVMERCGLRPTLYRPTFGQVTGTTLAAARLLGLQTVLWSAWGREWTTTDHRRVAELVGSKLDDGAIVLLHDNDAFGPPGMWRVGLRSLDHIAPEVDRRGLVPVTMGELVSGVPSIAAGS